MKKISQLKEDIHRSHLKISLAIVLVLKTDDKIFLSELIGQYGSMRSNEILDWQMFQEETWHYRECEKPGKLWSMLHAWSFRKIQIVENFWSPWKMVISEPKSAHLREVLLFAFNWKKSATEAHRMLEEVHGDHALSKSQCYRWFKKFQSGDFELDNEPRGKPHQKFEDAEQQALLNEDSTQTQEKLAKQLQVSQCAGSLRLNSLRMTQKLSRWVPHELSERQQERRLVTCEGLLARHEKKSFLHRIVTSDEKSIHSSNPMRQKSWGLLGQFPKQKPRPNRLGKKAMLCVWWDQTGVVYFKLLKPGETVNISRYEQQMHSLREALNEKRPELRENHNNLILQHDNAPAHNAKVLKNTIKDLGWELLPHPPYSPDLASSDYHLFTSLGHALKNQEFSNSDILRKWLVDWFDSKGIEFFRQGIRKLPERAFSTVETVESMLALRGVRSGPLSAQQLVDCLSGTEVDYGCHGGDTCGTLGLLNERMSGHRKRRQFKQTDAFTRGMVIGLKRAGWSIRQIAADTHLGASTVHRLWRRWLEQGNVAIYRNVGATRVTSARVDRRILRQAVAAPQATCTAILQHVQDTLDHSISTRTISRRSVANGLHSCRPLRRLPLTPPNRRQRLEWCRARSTWMTEWHRVVFSDESRFCLSSDSRRVRVWRRRGERSNPAAIVERPTVRQRGIMVWGAIAYDSRSPLLRIQGTMTAQRYVDDVLRPVTLPYLQGAPNALYQQDNVRPHTARISQQALQDVQMLPWPPFSPDLSPIEHVWDIIGRRLHALPQPRSEDELWQMVEREWRAIPQDAIRTLIDSLPRRVSACIAVRGGPTCY
ncbi:SETMAR [Cordylochernes scorpioides]|uniref:SETMAR n=1 Tax=Cordylochernes scorpioides TaxID=51811 RepID=A0ABY6LPT3_9ARAC|nr:SETMAR [Cordylochernes scorpioides]